jgi:hypothetical protein
MPFLAASMRGSDTAFLHGRSWKIACYSGSQVRSLTQASMLDIRPRISPSVLLACAMGVTMLVSCKRSEPPPDLLKTQRDAMDRAKEVGKTMQKGVDAEGKKADEEGK